MIVGDAAGFTLNTGMTIRGMDLAAGSAIAAATAASAALDSGDFSQAAMDRYVAEWKSSWLGADMETYKRAPAFLENDESRKLHGTVALQEWMQATSDRAVDPEKTSRTASATVASVASSPAPKTAASASASKSHVPRRSRRGPSGASAASA